MKNLPLAPPRRGRVSAKLSSTLLRVCRFSALVLLSGFLVSVTNAAQTNIPGPAGSGAFGRSVTVLTNGNIVVVDPLYDRLSPTVTDVGAVYLYSGATLTLISTLTGSTADDQVGSGGVTVLTNGNYVVRSPDWDNPSPLRTDVGAVTWVNGTSGISGVVTSSNSLIGSTANDQVGSGVDGIGVTALTNGNYVVSSPNWDNPSSLTVDVGAVTWCNGTSGTVGVVASSNSLVGGTAGAKVGSYGVTALTNGNYVVSSPSWDNPSPLRTNVGAVTWGNGTSGISGFVTASNSLIGGTAGDLVGYRGVTALTNGNYVVRSPFWNNPSSLTVSVGAVTWGNGTSGISGFVTSSNSLIGGLANDQVGFSGVKALTNGNYVVSSADWDNPSPLRTDVGAVTWGNGTSGISGFVTASNSLIGGTASDLVGSDVSFSGGVTALTNGNYVVSSPSWDNPSSLTVDVGAVTWGNGTSGITGFVTLSNSLIGGTANDRVGRFGVTALTNGNYVVNSAYWDNPSPLRTDVGAVTWCNGTSGISGFVTSSNSLIGGTAGDRVGDYGVTALTNGNYVVSSASWNNPLPLRSNAGAVTWGNGTSGRVGFVTASNSLIGGTAGDLVGSDGVTALTNGNYVVGSPSWDNPSSLTVDVGAVTWGNGTSGISGVVTSSNSLIGGTASDYVGTAFDGSGVTALTNGNYFVRSAYWDNPSPMITNSGAVTYGLGSGGTTGLITSTNSVRGTVTLGISPNSGIAFDALRNRLVVGRDASNIVSIFIPQQIAAKAPFDFDGDLKTDLSIFRPAPGQWWHSRSSDGGNRALTFGTSTDTIVPADFTGDGKTDIAFFRPSTGFWFVLRSEDNSFFATPFGTSGDVPVPTDFDADGKADVAVFRPSNSTWFINNSGGAPTTIQQFGIAGDVPVAADYDGDGKSDIAIYRPNAVGGGQWWIQRSSTNVVAALQFGTATDKTVVGDYTGDGKADIAFWRPSTGFWTVLRSEDLSFFAFPFGQAGDVPVPGDYDGDGKFDAGVFRPSNSTWFVQRSTAGTLIQQFGTTGDLPLPNAYVR